MTSKVLSEQTTKCDSLIEAGEWNDIIKYFSNRNETPGKPATMKEVRATALEVCIETSLRIELEQLKGKQLGKNRADYLHQMMFGGKKNYTLGQFRYLQRKLNKAIAYDVADAAFENWKQIMFSSEHADTSSPITERRE